MRPPPLAIRASAHPGAGLLNLWLSARGAVMTAGDGLPEEMPADEFGSARKVSPTRIMDICGSSGIRTSMLG
jgi:hypothetical protein